ncbi:MAG: hypothetical protein GY870_17590 [archaeon]|nr:hypothetical protein [archaeon]
MSKNTKIIFIVHFIALIILGLIVINLLNITDFSISLSENPNYISAFISIGIAVINSVLTIQMFSKYRERKTDIAAYLMGFFFFAAMAGFSNALFYELFHIGEIGNDMGIHFFMYETRAFSLGTQMIFLNLFINQTFSSEKTKKNNIYSIVTLICVFVWDFFLTLAILQETEAILMIGFLFVTILQIVLFTRLSINSNKLRKRFKQKTQIGEGKDKEAHNYERSFFFLMLVGVFLVIGFMMTTIYYTIGRYSEQLFEQIFYLDWLSMIFYLIAYYFLYLGFTYPSRGK